jgi:hypothetical protein
MGKVQDDRMGKVQDDRMGKVQDDRMGKVLQRYCKPTKRKECPRNDGLRLWKDFFLF